MFPLRPIRSQPWPQNSSIKTALRFSSLSSIKMPSHDGLEFCQSTSLIATVVLALTRRLKLPFTVVLVLVGIGLSALSGAYPHVLPALHDLEISSSLIFYVFLPTLIFESAFNLDAQQLRENLGSVLVLAGPGLLLSTMIIGFMVGMATP